MSTPRLLSTSTAGSSAKNVAFSMVGMQATLPSLSAGRMSAALRTLTMRSWLSMAWPLICATICAWKRAAWAVGILSGTNVAKHCAHGVLPIFASEMAQALPLDEVVEILRMRFVAGEITVGAGGKAQVESVAQPMRSAVSQV